MPYAAASFADEIHLFAGLIALRLHRGLIARGHESLLLAREGSPLFTAARAEQLPCEVMRPLRVRARGFDLLHAHDARSHSLAALLGMNRMSLSCRG